MTTDNFPPVIQAFLNPSFYPHTVDKVKLVQTHISYVLLAGDYVYKIKKPVDFGFLDFTSQQKREHFCLEELQLNRRLCPSLYLEVLPITKEGDTISLAGSGETIEHCLKMARMPEEKMMANVIKDGNFNEGWIDKIVDILVPFYEKAEGGDAIKNFGTAKAVSVNVLENFEQTESFIGCKALSQEQFDQINSYAKEYLANEQLFEQRIAAGRVRDCHGDLYSANICLADQVYIFDCIEFNQRFRYCDVASDVAFLAMDLDYQDMGNLSAYFIKRFVNKSNDQGLTEQLLNFYKCYRAYVRGKIGLFTAHSPEVDEATKEMSLQQAEKYFNLAHSYATSK